MATATIIDTIQNVRTLAYTHDSAVAKGDVIVVNGQVLIAVNDADANAENVYAYQGKAEFPKEANLAVSPGEICYWDESAGVMTKTQGGNTRAGTCIEASAASDTTLLVLLEPNRTKIRKVSVTVAAGTTAGSSAADTALVGAEVIGIYPTGNQDQLVDNVAVNADGSITVTLAAAATADNTFSVACLSV
ncbi:MAG: DUF2190 family protein [Deferribacteres bacterium]|nr:DUF2190 family protein [Deferribacteres bacterium]